MFEDGACSNNVIPSCYTDRFIGNFCHRFVHYDQCKFALNEICHNEIYPEGVLPDMDETHFILTR